MIDQGIEFFNVEELLPVEGLPGRRLYRFPRQLCESLGESWQHNARFRSQRVHGCEMRFVTQARCFDVVLTAYEGDIDMMVFRGDRVLQKYTLPAGRTTSIHLEVPALEASIDPTLYRGTRFPGHVWRLQFGVNGYLHFHTLDTYGWPRRPPGPDEEPSIRWLAYGSSITCGHVTTLYTNAYINQAARRLGWDVLNKGLSGSCFCEPQIGEYLAHQSVDCLTLELGVNMAVSFDPEEYERRVRTLMEKVQTNRSPRWIFVIDAFPYYGAWHRDRTLRAVQNYQIFKDITRALTAEAARRDARFISMPGERILRNPDGLSCDLLHPSDEGHILMGQALAEEIQAYTKEAKQ